MEIKDWILSFVEAGLWYGALYFGLYTIKHDVNLFAYSLIILAFVYAACISCPLVRNMQAWKDLWRNK